MEHAEEAYRHVEGLSEVQAGRARTLIGRKPPTKATLAPVACMV